MVKVNEIAFSIDRYDGKRDEMYKDIMIHLSMLMKNEYICKVREEEGQVVVIEFEHDNNIEPWGGPDLVWVDQETLEQLECIMSKEKED